MATTVRHAMQADIPALHSLLRAYAIEGDLQFIEDEAALRAYLVPPPCGFLLAECNGTLCGCVLLRRLNSVSFAAECKRLFVLSAHRGRGIANLLMDTVEDGARIAGFRWIYLDSKDDFQTAIAMYSRRGYQACKKFNDNPRKQPSSFASSSSHLAKIHELLPEPLQSR